MDQIEINSVAELEEVVKLIFSCHPVPCSIGLSGPLGAGKTELVRAIAKYMGVEEQITSPSYVLEHIYKVPGHFQGFSVIHHWDLYRLNSAEFIEEIAEQVSAEDQLLLIEWPEKVPEIEDLLSLKILIDYRRLSSEICSENISFEDEGGRIIRLKKDYG